MITHNGSGPAALHKSHRHKGHATEANNGHESSTRIRIKVGPFRLSISKDAVKFFGLVALLVALYLVSRKFF